MLLENLLDFISIEPMRENLTCLIENVRRFKLKNVVVIDKALSDRDGFERLLAGKRSRTSQLAYIFKSPELVDHEEVVESAPSITYFHGSKSRE